MGSSFFSVHKKYNAYNERHKKRFLSLDKIRMVVILIVPPGIKEVICNELF